MNTKVFILNNVEEEGSKMLKKHVTVCFQIHICNHFLSIEHMRE